MEDSVKMIIPIGTLVCALCVVVGGLIGSAAGNRISSQTKDALNLIFALVALSMGIIPMPGLANLPAVVLAVILGTLLGLKIKLGDKVRSGLGKLAGGRCTEEFLTIAVLFCVSGTGYYGSLVEGVTGDHSILLAKAIMDLFTSAILACKLGKSVSLLGIPQCVIHLVIFFIARWIYPLCAPYMIADFKAVGGYIMLATGLRMLKLKEDLPTADMIPSLVIALPISWLWSTFITPLL